MEQSERPEEKKPDGKNDTKGSVVAAAPAYEDKIGKIEAATA